MNLPRYLLTTVVMFTFIVLYEILFHDFIIFGMYEATVNVWRDFAEMEASLPIAMCFKLALAAWTVFIFSQVHPEGGIKNGLIFGLFMGVFAGILTAQWYLWLKVPLELGLSWFLISVGEGLFAGLIAGSIYHKRILTSSSCK